MKHDFASCLNNVEIWLKSERCKHDSFPLTLQRQQCEPRRPRVRTITLDLPETCKDKVTLPSPASKVSTPLLLL